jgi:hypothetical protein
MKIHFTEVSGKVGIDDKYSFQDAITGMTLETGGRPYIIMVGDNSSARLIIGTKSEEIHLGANSILHTNYARPCLLDRAAKDLRILSGKIWAKLDRNEWDPNQPNAVVGVRG